MHLRSLKPQIFSRKVEKPIPPAVNEKKSSPSSLSPSNPVASTGALKCKIQLNRKGKADVEVLEGGPILEPLLKQTVANDRMTYQACDATPDRERHVLLDKQGRLLSLARTPEGFIGVTHSQQPDAWKSVEKKGLFHRSKSLPPPALSVNNAFVSVAGKKIPLPGKALNETLTETTSDPSGRYRLHMKHLFRFNDTTASWEPHGNQSEKKSLLSVQADGNVWAVTADKKISPVAPLKGGFETLNDQIRAIGSTTSTSENRQPVIELDSKVEHFSVSREGHAIVQTANDDDKIQRIRWIENIREPQSMVELYLPEGMSCRKTAIFDKTVFALDYRGALQCAPLPSKHDRVLHFDSGAMNVRTQKINEAIKKIVGPGFKFEEIGNVEDDRLHVVVKDSQERKHFIAVKLDREKVEVDSSWNITDAMILDHQKGLTPFQPQEKDVIDLDRMGKVTVYDNRPYFLNERSGQWELTNEDRSDRLKLSRLRAGLDGQPWMISVNSEVKKLKVREATTKLTHSNAVFMLPQVKKSVSIDQAISGMEENHFLSDVAAADPGNVITLNHYGQLHFHTGGSNRIISREQLAEMADRPDLKVSEIAMTNTRDLVMLSSRGELMTINERQWSGGKIHPMLTIKPPLNSAGVPTRFIALHTIGPGIIACEDPQRELWTRDGGVWVKTAPRQTQPDRMTDQLDALKEHDHVTQFAKGNLRFKSHVHLGGMEKQQKVKTPLSARINAFVFRPTMEWPRPLKNLGNAIHHQVSGRDGLADLYKVQPELSTMIRTIPGPDTPLQTPVKTKISSLSQVFKTPEEEKLFQDLNDFADLLSASTSHYSKIMGRHYGFLDAEFRPLTRPKIRRNTSSRFNPATTRATNLGESFQRLLQYYPVDLDNSAGNLLERMVEKKVVINEQKDVIPMGMNRDAFDKIALVKSRLIHDCLCLYHLHKLVDEIQEGLLPSVNRSEFVEKMTAQAASLRFNLWDQNPVKAFTDQGFYNHRQLEAVYDAIRQTSKAFSKEDHGVNITSRSVLEANTQHELQQNLLDTLKSMETGESIAFSRNYGANASVTSYFSSAVFIGANATGRLDRGFMMNIGRTENAFTVSFARSFAASGTLSVALVDNLFSAFDPAHPVFLDAGHHFPMSKTLLLGGGATLSGRDSKTFRVTMTVGESELAPFIEQLVSGELDPVEVMSRGSHHQTDKIRQHDLNLSLSAQASAYVTLPLVDNRVPHETSMVRFRAQAGASLSVAGGSRERSRSVTGAGLGMSRTANRVTGFDRGGVAAQFDIPTGPRFFSNGSVENVTLYASSTAAFTAAFDNRTNHKLRIELTDAPEVSTTQIEGMISRLERYFTDNDSQMMMARLKRKRPNTPVVSPKDKLAELNTHFAQWFPSHDPNTPSRFGELRGHGHKAALLALQSLVRSQEAFEKKAQLISRAEFQTTYQNLARLDHNSFSHYVGNMTGFGGSLSNADRLKGMMEDDHQLAGFIDKLRENPHAIAMVNLEFNPATRERIEREWAQEKLTQEQIGELLKDRRNIRLKSVVFTQTMRKSDGFASPNFILGGSNGASVSMTEHLGTIHFSYLDDNEMTPASYVLKGRVALRENAITAAMDSAREAGFVLRAMN
ncbi:hypothetical protein C1Y41_04300 [Pantoea sp. ICBG 1758]|uniref:AvrE-family type 3 secretion system effector n=1 Tax=Pantoea sp. ICBG 1758 TaxID=2071682 RepID=UPI000CE2D495|nr:AvrE-family type 3 secretion system effector [Pantoea sp. ICBG 1758]PPC63872.1 hypothetical protein C1Y41_04300 [Pantoea sp. ICBG 1758]